MKDKLIGLLGGVAEYLIDETQVADKLISRIYILIFFVLCLLLMIAVAIGLLLYTNHQRKMSARGSVSSETPEATDDPGESVKKQSDRQLKANTDYVRGSKRYIEETEHVRGGRRADAREGRIRELTVTYTIPGMDEQRRVFEHPDTIYIGRGRDNTLVIPYLSVSLRHVCLRCDGDTVWISNISTVKQGKQNTLFVGDRPISSETRIDNGCQVNMGMVMMMIKWSLAEYDH